MCWPTKLSRRHIGGKSTRPTRFDLIPDFIPVIGYLDDIILVPLGILLAVKLVPDDLMVGCRTEADLRVAKPISRSGAISVIVIWLAAAALAALWFLRTPV